ncbi:Protein kinase-like domain [Pseudocohnilembus persalinus]|uniref:Protein kinase-like domain n=1 Tax=Pseudocohnilembus persalinus TaxID=266149 RepID=A0A0V0QCR4_PSEPJ|nr:Protein kinase-like domain [Pseudocohnilembus persalinus]|eukprot:KRX00006.1 Protein kinase-like domain [Pseudocohnilembus persalinus]
MTFFYQSNKQDQKSKQQTWHHKECNYGYFYKLEDLYNYRIKQKNEEFHNQMVNEEINEAIINKQSDELQEIQKLVLQDIEEEPDIVGIKSIWLKTNIDDSLKQLEISKMQQKSLFCTNNKCILDISQEYFEYFYKEIQLLGGGSFGKVSLYYDTNLEKLLAVKTFTEKLQKRIKKGQYETKKIDLILQEEEMLSILSGIRNNDIKDDQKQGKRRNIEREIKQSFNLSKDNSEYISQFIGVILMKQEKQEIIKQKSNQLNNQQYDSQLLYEQMCQKKDEGRRDSYSQDDAKDGVNSKKNIAKLNNKINKKEQNNNKKEHLIYKSVKLVFEYFGDFGIKKSEKIEFISDLRQFQNQKSDSQVEMNLDSQFSIEEDFDEEQFVEIQKLSKQISVLSYKNLRNNFIHPRLMIQKYLNKQDIIYYDKKDDIYSLGIVILSLHEQLKTEINNRWIQIIQDLTGFQYQDIKENYQSDHKLDKVQMVKVIQDLHRNQIQNTQNQSKLESQSGFIQVENTWKSDYLDYCWNKIKSPIDLLQKYF